MGEPSDLSEQQQADALTLARLVVDAVRNNEAWPAPLELDGETNEMQLAVLQLCQLVMLRDQQLASVNASLCHVLQRENDAHDGDFTTPRSRPYLPDAYLVERAQWFRASGDAVCPTCWLAYYTHAPVPGYTWLRRLCDGRMVKL